MKSQEIRVTKTHICSNKTLYSFESSADRHVPFVELMESQGIIKKVMKPLVLKDRNKVIASENI